MRSHWFGVRGGVKLMSKIIISEGAGSVDLKIAPKILYLTVDFDISGDSLLSTRKYLQ